MFLRTYLDTSTAALHRRIRKQQKTAPAAYAARGGSCWGLRLGLLFSEHAAFYAGGGEGAVAAEERAVGRLNVRLEFLAAFGEDFFGDEEVEAFLRDVDGDDVALFDEAYRAAYRGFGRYVADGGSARRAGEGGVS